MVEGSLILRPKQWFRMDASLTEGPDLGVLSRLAALHMGRMRPLWYPARIPAPKCSDLRATDSSALAPLRRRERLVAFLNGRPRCSPAEFTGSVIAPKPVGDQGRDRSSNVRQCRHRLVLRIGREVLEGGSDFGRRRHHKAPALGTTKPLDSSQSREAASSCFVNGLRTMSRALCR